MEILEIMSLDKASKRPDQVGQPELTRRKRYR